jgi:outer membrane protein OmpA-like peptidoglycan-associated protein
MRRRAIIFAVLFLTGAATLLAAQLASLLPSFFGSDTEDTAQIAEPGSKPAAPGSPEKAGSKPAQNAGLDAGLAPQPHASALAVPELDISRISPSGSSVFAGRAQPHSYVTVYENDTPVGSVKADENGEWSLVTEHRFASLEPNLAFKAGAAPLPTPDTASSAKTPQVAASADGGKAVAADASPEAVAKKLMSGFEKLVAEAREESKAEAAKPETAPGSVPTVDVPAAAPPPAQVAAAPPAEVSVSDAPKAAASAAAPETATPRVAAAEPGASQKPVPVQGSASIPVPIMFVYNEAQFTDEGRRAEELLLEYLKLKHLKSISLSGHADERGSDDYNLDLSRERLDAVARYLRGGGFSGDLDLVPKGKSEPFSGIDRGRFSGEALYQFDRRVELRVYR